MGAAAWGVLVGWSGPLVSRRGSFHIHSIEHRDGPHPTFLGRPCYRNIRGALSYALAPGESQT